MASKLDLIVRKHVLPVLDKEGIEVGLREVSAIARGSGYTVRGNRLYRQPSDSEKPVRESHNKLADYIKWYIKTKTASEADDIGEKPGETAAVAAAESAQPTDSLAPKAGEIKVPSEPHLPNAGTGADVPSVRLSDTFAGQIEDHLAAKGLTPEEQEKIDRRRTYLDSFVQNIKGKILSGSLVNLQNYFAEVREQYKVEILSGIEDVYAFANQFARLAFQRNSENIARQYGDALENLLEKDSTGALAAAAARSLPGLYERLTARSVDKFLTGAVQRIDEYNALPKRKRTKAAWGEVVNYFAVSSTQAMMDRDSLLVEEHPQLLEDLAAVKNNLQLALKDSSNITEDKFHEQLRAKRAEGEVAALKGDLDTEKSIAGGYKNSSRAFKYLSGVALVLGLTAGAMVGRSYFSSGDRQESDRHEHEAEVLKNENTRLNDSLKDRTNMLNLSRDKRQEAESTVEQLRQESAYAFDLQEALTAEAPSPAAVESIVDRYINERGQGRVVVHASTCQSAMKYLHHLMGGAAEQEDAFVRALKDRNRCKKDIKIANLYIFEP